jgi:hypothetical protein
MRATLCYRVLNDEHTLRESDMADSTFTFRIEEDLKAAFATVASAQEHTAAQLLRLLMRGEVKRWNESHAHDAWFRAEVAQALDEAADPTVDRTPHEQVLTSWRQQRAELERRAAGRTA